LRGSLPDGSQREHRRLYGRLLALAVFIVTSDLLCSFVVYFTERHASPEESHITTPWRAFVWTTSQLLTGGSSLAVASK
jgi:hypothetical protein